MGYFDNAVLVENVTKSANFQLGNTNSTAMRHNKWI